MKKILVLLAVTLFCTVLSAQNRYISGGAIDKIVPTEDGRGTVGVRAISWYDLETKKYEIYIWAVASNSYGPVSMRGMVTNIIPMYVDESPIRDGQTFVYDVNHSGNYSTRVSGNINFTFANSDVVITLPVNIDVPKP